MKKALDILLYLWQLPQNLLGALLVLILRPGRNYDYRGVRLHYASRMRGGISLGRHIILNDTYRDFDGKTEKHEWGHTRQSLLLGPLYLPLVGLPSLLWAAWWTPLRSTSYFRFFTERWADRLGGVRREPYNNKAMEPITLEQIAKTVREASRLMVRDGFTVKEKGTLENIVTTSDVAVQDFLTGRLAELLPGSGFLCEEEDLEDLDHEYVWIIDPIDGTANYARGIASCCISVALIRNGKPLYGVVYSPWRGELYTAEAGKGAFCNGTPIRVSDRSFKEGLLFTAMSTYRKEFAKTCSDIIYDLYMDCNDVRRTGSAAVELCLMAAGKAELYFEIRLMPWDYAAASLILTEAGGTLAGFDGNAPSLYRPSMVIAANSKDSLRKILEAVHRHLDALPY